MIVVTAPTGKIGRLLLERLVDAGEDVRVIVRDPARLPAGVRGRVEAVRGSHADAGVVAEAFAGADSVFWLVPPDVRAPDVRAHYLDFTRAACEAFRERGVTRVVGVSSMGREFDGKAGQMSAAFAMDGLIEGTGVAYRALRMPFFMENLLAQAEGIAAGVLAMPAREDRTFACCAVRDIAGAAAALLADGGWDGQGGVPVLGPDDLAPGDMARIMSDVLERPVRYERVPIADYEAMFVRNGMSGAWARGMAEMADAQNRGAYDVGPGTERSATGFRRWCEDVLRPAVRA